jgi:hypothetical protein
MNVRIEDVSSVKKKLSFEVGADKVDAEIGKAYQQIAKSAKIKGCSGRRLSTCWRSTMLRRWSRC